MPPPPRQSNEENDPSEQHEQFRDERDARIEVRRILLKAVEQLTRKVELQETEIAVNRYRNDAIDKSMEKFVSLSESYAELKGHLKMQNRVFSFISALLVVIIGGLVVAYLKKP